MPEQRVDRFFPAESVVHKKDALSTVYRMEFAEGFGTMTSWKVMPGVTLIFNDFHTPCGFPEEARCPGLIEINHCLEGRFECTMRDGRCIWLGPQDFAVSDMGHPPTGCNFSQGVYRGISLVVEPEKANPELSRMLGEGAPYLPELFARLLDEQTFLLLRSEPKIQHIFSEMYDAPEAGRLAYYRLKSAELMLFLRECLSAARHNSTYLHNSTAEERVRLIASRMTEDLRTHLPLSELAAQYCLSLSTVKKYFRRLYGESPYAYLKRRRMEEAAFLLTAADKSVTWTAAAVGYQNTSKFSAAFRDIYGISPTEYKKTHKKTKAFQSHTALWSSTDASGSL